MVTSVHGAAEHAVMPAVCELRSIIANKQQVQQLKTLLQRVLLSQLPSKY